MNGEERLLSAEIERRTARGWELVQRQALEAQMRRPKRFSFFWALVWFLLFGVGIIVYLLWHWAKRDELIFLRIENGELRVTGERRGLLGVLWAPVVAYWRWAGRRQTTLTKGLAYGSPVVALVTVIIVIAAASAGGGGEEEEGVLASEATRQATAAAAQEEFPTPAEEKVERIVRAAPGVQAEAEGVRITLNETVDPWVSENMFIQPDPGRRFVAFDVTIEQVGGSHLASEFNFQLTDVEGFAYDTAFLGAEPPLQMIDLGKGQKTRGWVTFEVNEGTPLKLLKYDPNPFTTKDIEFQW